MNARKVVPPLLVVAFSAWLIGTASGQSVIKDPPVQLHVSRNYPLPALVCTGGVSVLMERESFLAQLSGGPTCGGTLHRIRLDGSSDTQFNIQSVLRPSELTDRTPSALSFTSSSSGDVFILTSWNKPYAAAVTNILHFDSHGAFEGIIPSELQGLQIQHMTKFRDGKFILIAGTTGAGYIGSVEVVILGDDGKIIVRKPLRKLSESEIDIAKKQNKQDAEEILARMKASAESKPSSNEKEKEASSTSSPSPQAARPAQEMSALYFRTLLVSDEEGIIYLTRPDKPGAIYRVASDLEMTEIPLGKDATAGPADSGGNTQLKDALVSAGQLILFYSKSDTGSGTARPTHVVSTSIKTYSLFDGEPTGTYVGEAASNGTVPVGWSKEGASYLRYSRTSQPPGWEIVLSSR